MSLCAAAPELAGWGEQLGGGVERRTVVNPFPRAVSGLATVIDISHGQHLHVRWGCNCPVLLTFRLCCHIRLRSQWATRYFNVPVVIRARQVVTISCRNRD